MQIFEQLSLSQIGATFAVLFAVIDILGSIPIIVDIRSKVGHIQSEKAAIAAGVLMISFLFFGTKILTLFNVDVEAFAVAGAFVIFVIALEMILGIEIQKGVEANSASIVPIAFPLVAGAGSLTTVLSLRAQYDDINIVVGILLNMIIVYLVLKFAGKLEKILGPAVLSILKKVFGIVLLSIAIKLFTTNIGTLFINEFNI
ncbi:MarC family protein [Vaginella massiliensis]|uniref:MarC family protein n=1 Tax=Vaginella massiliensis TaxID=1816680 RepID=UPI0008390690|nr:MarC family protein [Vaginella massiliensis]